MPDAPILFAVPPDATFTRQRGLATLVKDAAAIGEYGWDLTGWLKDDERITSADVQLTDIIADDPDTSGDPTVHVDGDSTGGRSIWVRLSGGGTHAQAKCTFTTSAGRTEVRRIRFLIRER